MTGKRKKLVGIEQSMYSRGEISLELIESTILEPIEEKYLLNVSAIVLVSVISILFSTILLVLLCIPWVLFVFGLTVPNSSPYFFLIRRVFFKKILVIIFLAQFYPFSTRRPVHWTSRFDVLRNLETRNLAIRVFYTRVGMSRLNGTITC